MTPKLTPAGEALQYVMTNGLDSPAEYTLVIRAALEILDRIQRGLLLDIEKYGFNKHTNENMCSSQKMGWNAAIKYLSPPYPATENLGEGEKDVG
jgi:hypothetical protein